MAVGCRASEANRLEQDNVVGKTRSMVSCGHVIARRRMTITGSVLSPFDAPPYCYLPARPARCSSHQPHVYES